MKLYLIDVEFCGGEELVVLADDYDEAKNIAIEGADLVTMDARVVDSVEIEKLEDIPEWWRDQLPLGDADITCVEWLQRQEHRKRQAKAAKPDPRQLSLSVREEEA